MRFHMNKVTFHFYVGGEVLLSLFISNNLFESFAIICFSSAAFFLHAVLPETLHSHSCIISVVFSAFL